MNAIQRSFIFAFTLMFVFVVNATAQHNLNYKADPLVQAAFDGPAVGDTEEDFPRATEYYNMPLSDWNNDWWTSLEQEISLEAKSYRSLSGNSLQNAIFFLANHNDRVDLSSSVPVLLDVYLYNKSEAKRIMALAALTLIGDQGSLETAEKMLYKQRSERVKNFSITALTAYKANLMKVQVMMAEK